MTAVSLRSKNAELMDRNLRRDAGKNRIGQSSNQILNTFHGFDECAITRQHRIGLTMRSDVMRGWQASALGRCEGPRIHISTGPTQFE